MPSALDLRRQIEQLPQSSAVLFSWEAEEFGYWPKSREWYVAIGIFSFAILVVAFLTKNILLGIMAPLIFFLLVVYGAKRPRKLRYTITAAGIIIGSRLWKYDTLKSFWIFYEPDNKEVSVENKALLLPRLTLPLGNEDPNEVRKVLVQFLPEKEQEQSLIDIWMRKLKF